MADLEALSLDILEEDFIRIFRPVIFLQTILSCGRVNIKYRFVTLTPWYQKLHASIYVLYNLIINVYIMYEYTRHIEPVNQKDIMGPFLFICEVSLSFAFECFVIIGNQFFSSRENATLFVTLQRLHRCGRMLTGKDRRYLKYAYRFVIVSCVLSVMLHTKNIINLFKYESIPLKRALMLLPTVIMFSVEDFEKILYLTLLLFIWGEAKLLNECLDTLDSEDGVDSVRNIHMAYQEISRAITIIEKVYGPFILVLTIHTFTFHLIWVQKLIYFTKVKHYIVYIYDWSVIKTSCVIGMMGLVVRNLRKQLQRCLVICHMHNHTSRTVNEELKNLSRTLRLVQPLTVMGIFPVQDLPVNLISTTAAYAIVLLQFGYTKLPKFYINETTTTSSTSL